MKPRQALCCLCLLAAWGCGVGKPDPKNELPFGAMDTPANGATVRRSVVVGGWALDDSAVSAVRVYVDGKFTAQTQITVPRPDVSRRYPKYAKGTDLHGWMVPIAIAQPGVHAILAQAVDDQRATRDLGNVSVIVLPPQ